MTGQVYATDGLLEVLVEFGRDADPEQANVALVARPAADLVGTTDLDADTPVFAEFYFPGVGASITSVFGMDLSTPAGTAGRFVSHPGGNPEVALTDDLHAVVFVAVPPWEPDNVWAYDRSGPSLEIVTVAAATPERSLE